MAPRFSFEYQRRIFALEEELRKYGEHRDRTAKFKDNLKNEITWRFIDADTTPGDHSPIVTHKYTPTGTFLGN